MPSRAPAPTMVTLATPSALGPETEMSLQGDRKRGGELVFVQVRVERRRLDAAKRAQRREGKGEEKKKKMGAHLSVKPSATEPRPREVRTGLRLLVRPLPCKEEEERDKGPAGGRVSSSFR